MAGLFPGLFQARGPGPGQEEARGQADLVPEDIDVGFQQQHDILGGSLHLPGGLESACLHAAGAQGDHAELFVE